MNRCHDRFADNVCDIADYWYSRYGYGGDVDVLSGSGFDCGFGAASSWGGHDFDDVVEDVATTRRRAACRVAYVDRTVGFVVDDYVSVILNPEARTWVSMRL